MLRLHFNSQCQVPAVPMLPQRLVKRSVNNCFKLKKFLMAAVAITTFGTAVEGYAREAVTGGNFAGNGSDWTQFFYYSNLNTKPYAVLSNVYVTDNYNNALGYKNIYTIDTTTGWNGGIVSNAISQKIILNANTYYKVTFKARTETVAPSDLFVSIRKPDQSPGYVDGTTVMEKRVLVSSSGLATYTFYFKTPEVLTGDTYLYFSGASIGVQGAQRGKIGIADVSITDNPSFTQNVNYYMTPSSQVSIDINQLGYLGKDKPLIFTVRGYSPNWETSLAPSLYRNGVKVANVPAATLVQSAIDSETNEKVLTFSMNVSSVSVPANDVQTNQPYGMREQGYQIGLDSNNYYKPTLIFSKPFQISPSLYNILAVDALNYFKANRANEAIAAVPGRAVHSRGESMSYQNNGRDPKAYHNERDAGPAGDAIATCRGGLDNFGNDFTNTPCTFPNGLTTLNVEKGWFDAGDQGKYVVNGGVSLWTLQNQIERIQSGISAPAYSDQLAQLLNEARYEMDFMWSMQAPSGTTAVVPVGWQGGLYNNNYGVYQVALGDNQTVEKRLANNASGAVIFNGGRLPRLQIKLALTNEDVSGMVFHSVYDEKWTNIPTAPARNTERRLLSYPTSAATFNFAAVAAQCSRIFKSVDPDYAQKCLDKAKTAWNAAILRRDNKKDIYRYEYSNNGWSGVDPNGTASPNYLVVQNGFGLLPQWSGGGAYGDVRFKDEVYWAAMELYLATNDGNYLVKLTREFNGDNDYASGQYSKCTAVPPKTVVQKDFPAFCYDWNNGFDWQNVMTLGTISALSTNVPAASIFKTTEADGNATSTAFSIPYTDSVGVVQKLNYTTSPRKNLLELADNLVSQVNKQAFRFPKIPYTSTGNTSRNSEYDWGSNGSVLNRALILGVAFDLTGNKTYGNAAMSAMDYILGRNANSVSYVTGYGNRPVQYPHHRYWAKLADNVYPETPAGALLGGPNSRDIQSIFANADHCTNRSKDKPYSCLGTFDPAAIGPGDADNKYFIETVAKNCLVAKAPQKCFADSHHSFASSEVAINWNAPLVWMATFLNNYGSK